LFRVEQRVEGALLSVGDSEIQDPLSGVRSTMIVGLLGHVPDEQIADFSAQPDEVIKALHDRAGEIKGRLKLGRGCR
jgi:hypothetical protein